MATGDVVAADQVSEVTAVWPVVCATGHRPQHIPADRHEWVRAELDRVALKLRDEHGTTVGISGMALGTDMWWARSVLAGGLELHAYVPFPQQPDRWPTHAQREWRRLLDLAARVHYTADRFHVRYLHLRNGEMIRDSAAAVAVWNPGKADGGTYQALKLNPGLPVVHIDPAAAVTRLTTAGRLVDPEAARQGTLAPG